MVLSAPAKLNLCLFLGPLRDDGLHEIRSLFEPLSLADRIEVSEASRDSVVCPGVEGENLAAAALGALRERGWGSAPLRLRIEKRIPIAGGLGGGSADAAAVLRLGDGEVTGVEEAATALGADVLSQLRPAFALIGGAGSGSGRSRQPQSMPSCCCAGLRACAPRTSTRRPTGWGAIVIARRSITSRNGCGRRPPRGASPLDYADLLVNDLGAGATSLRPEIEDSLEVLRAAGAAQALISGSGPTAFGLFPDRDAAAAAAAQIGAPAIACTPVTS